MKKSVVGIFVLAVFAASLILAASPSFAQQAITLKYSNFFPAPHQNSIIADAWCKEVEKRTNGRVKITYFPGATLTPPPQTYDSVTKGIADIGLSLFGYTMGKFPMMTAIDLPLGYKSAYAATKMINEYYKKFQPKELDEVKVMYLSAHGPGVVHTKKPVTKLEEFKGMKMRATGQTAQIVKALGGAPVGMPMTESYDALSKGVVDGVMCPMEALKGWKLAEVCANTTLNFGSAYSSGFFVVMNKAKWNSIPKADQAIIEKINEEWIDKQGKLWDSIDKEGYELVKQRGDKIIALSPEEDARWAKAAYPVIEDYIKQLKAKNLPGDEAIKWMQDYLKKNDKVPN
jgi:TRAP-type C4-dicarboxylate transport system substrate-binding protein